MSLAIFDLDNTLLRGDSDYAWGQYLIERGVVDGEHYREANERYYQQYHAGTLDIMEFLAFALRPLAAHDLTTLDAWHEDYMRVKVLPMITDDARALVERHRAAGDTLMIITATNSFVTRPIARAFGVSNLLATEPEMRDGRFTGNVAGIPCFRDGKVKRLDAWLHEHDKNLAGSWFYSDSHNDLPLLERVAHPVAVNPDEILTDTAQERGWPILQLR